MQTPAMAEYNVVFEIRGFGESNVADFAFAMNVGVVPDLYSQ